MSASPYADLRPDPTTAPLTAAATGPGPSPGRRALRRLGAAALVAAVAAGSGFVVHDVRTAEATAAAAEIRSARSDLAVEISHLRAALADPTRDGQTVATALLRRQVAELAGEPADTELTAHLIAQLRGAADDLEIASTTPLPQRPSVLPVAVADPIFARLSGLESQAADVAAAFRDAADVAEAWSATLAELTDAARAYGEVQLPASSDPATVQQAWEDERERLDAYEEAIMGADAGAARPSLQPLADAQLDLVIAMRELADDAVALLDDGDLDAYNELLAERADDERLDVATSITAAREVISERAVSTGDLEATRARALGLLLELEELRRVTPAQLAGRTDA